MKTHERELLIYYNPSSNSARKTVAHAQSVVLHVKTYAFGQIPSTTTSWQTILNALNLHPKEILNKADPYYQKHLRGKEFDEESWVNIIKHNSNLIKAPIAIRGKRAILCNSPTDIYKLYPTIVAVKV